MTRPLPRASELYALSQGKECSGSQPCHWCGAPCEREWTHDDPPPLIGVKSNSHALFPGSPYICLGCKLFRRPRLTAWFLGGGFKDGQCPLNHSWLITPKGAWTLDHSFPDPIYKFLLKPDLLFCLAFLTERGISNRLQFMKVNENEEVKANTSLAFTINNIPHTYSIYELEAALRGEPDGKEPGVQALFRLLGPYMPPQDIKEVGKSRGKGRPNRENIEAHSLRRVISRSG